MHTSLRHYAITLERDALVQRSPRFRYEVRTDAASTRSLLDRIPSVGRIARRRPALGI